MCPDQKKKKDAGRERPRDLIKAEAAAGLARQREGEGRSLGAEKVYGESLAE